jgi:serine/threonine-protein kinase
VGSLNYVAPEALSGALVEESADTYSLATIAYYLLTGEHPYAGRSPREIFQQLLTQPARPMRETAVGSRLSVALEATIMRSLSREPGQRHPSVLAFAEDLQRAAAGTTTTARAQGASEAGAGAGGSLLGSLKSLFGRKRDE